MDSVERARTFAALDVIRGGHGLNLVRGARSFICRQRMVAGPRNHSPSRSIGGFSEWLTRVPHQRDKRDCARDRRDAGKGR